QINWVGFYLLKQDQLVLGPFQGLPACVRIDIGSGVCGTAVQEKRSIVVDDVKPFPGHSFWVAPSHSKLLVQIFKGEDIFGVLDIDSPIKERFDEVDRIYLEKFVHLLVASI